MKTNRWIYAVVGVVVLLFAGLIYAWSVLASPLAAYFTEWSSAQLSLTFTICMSAFCLGGLAGGLTSGRWDVKYNVWAAALLFLAGFVLASKANSLAMLYLGYGVLCGFGSGLAYNAVMSTMTKWFPDKPGLISGILLMGFGIGAFLIGKVYQAVTPSGVGVDAWRDSFFAFGVILFVVLAVGGFFFKKPGADFAVPVAKKKMTAPREEGIEATPDQVLCRPSFWCGFFWAVFLCMAALALISQATAIAVSISPETPAGTIATVVGMISVFNGVGRVLFGSLFDRAGRKVTMYCIDGAFLAAVAVLLAALLTKQFVLLAVGFALIGTAYGGCPTMSSAFISAFYGAKHYPVNFSLMNCNLLLASFGSTIAGALYDASGSFLSTMVMLLGTVTLGTILSLCIKRP